MLTTKNALTDVCIGIFLFPSEDNVNCDRCTAQSDTEISFLVSHPNPLGGRQQVRRKWTVSKQDLEDHLCIIDLTAFLAGRVRFTRILARTLEKCELNAEECLCEDLRSGKHSAWQKATRLPKGFFSLPKGRC